ncbi:hypothetical protein MAHJHV57_51960 [Mycobacterium avium subsp. hominissuis]
MPSAARSRKLSFSMRSPERGAPFFCNGAPRSGERIEKLNFLLRAAAVVAELALLAGH